MTEPIDIDDEALLSRFRDWLRDARAEADGLNGDRVEVDLAGRPDHGVSVRLVSDAMLVDHSLIPRAKEAPQLIDTLREQMGELAA